MERKVSRHLKLTLIHALFHFSNEIENNKLSSWIYKIILTLYNAKQVKSQWIDNRKHILCELGFSGIWSAQNFLTSNWLEAAAKQRALDHFIQNWYTNINATSNSNSYKLLKTKFERSPYEPRHDKTNKLSVRPAKTQISLGIRPVWSESSLSAWRQLGSLAAHWAHREDSDQTGRTVILLVFVMSWLIYKPASIGALYKIY